MSNPPISPVPSPNPPAPTATPAATIPLRPLGAGLGGGLKIAGARPGAPTKPVTLQAPGAMPPPMPPPVGAVPPPLPGAPRPPAVPSAFTPPTAPVTAAPVGAPPVTAPGPLAPTVPISAGLRPPMPPGAGQAAYNAPSVALAPNSAPIPNAQGAPTGPISAALPTAAMPAATVSLTPTIGINTATALRTGGTRQDSVNTMDIAEEPKENTFLLSLSIAAAVLAIVFCILQYNVDQIPHRTSIGTFGDPLAVPVAEEDEESY